MRKKFGQPVIIRRPKRTTQVNLFRCLRGNERQKSRMIKLDNEILVV